MERTMFTKSLDELGRIHIPKDIRLELNIKEGEPFEIWIDGEDIVMRRVKNEIEQRGTGEI